MSDYKIRPGLWRYWSYLEGEAKREELLKLSINELEKKLKSKDLAYATSAVLKDPEKFRILFLNSPGKAAEILGLSRSTCINYRRALRELGIDVPDFRERKYSKEDFLRAMERFPNYKTLKQEVLKIVDEYGLLSIGEVADMLGIPKLSSNGAKRQYGIEGYRIYDYLCIIVSRISKKQKSIPLEILLDYVFNTRESLDEILSFEEIKRRVENVLGYEVDEELLKKKVDFLVKVGFYEEVEEGKYKAGMPGAMDGLLEKTFEELTKNKSQIKT